MPKPSGRLSRVRSPILAQIKNLAPRVKGKGEKMPNYTEKQRRSSYTAAERAAFNQGVGYATAKALEEAGYPSDLTAREFSIPGMVECILKDVSS